MCDVYRVSCSVKVKQMEAELQQQLAALRAEIEENGFPRGAVPTSSHSSVAPPKDVSFFRLEREHTLKRALQVAEALPVCSQADIMQRELESCLSLEYTADSLPPLLHQFYTDRSYHLAQIKYQLMLRWTRFCRHTSVIEQLYPHYKAQVLHLTREYEDAIQRACRLSESRENILRGRKNSASLLTQDDVVIYLRWLVCHLHSVQNVHNFLRVLHYMPVCERNNKEARLNIDEETDADGFSELAEDIPHRAVDLQEFLPELQSLITYFHLPYDTDKLRTSADETELFSMVWKKFRVLFKHQEQMRVFPQYDATEVRESEWGRTSANMALMKEANWIPFIQVKPRRDPWQQKLVTKLKESKSVEELLKMHCRFLQDPHLLHVAAALKQHASHICDPQSTSVSHCSKPPRQKIFEIWSSFYNTAMLTQETHNQSCSSGYTGGSERVKNRPTMSANGSLQVLGLDDGLEEVSSDPVVTRGAHLSLIFLQHLKLRELQRVSLGLLNYLRSVERTLTFDLAGLRMEEQELCSTAPDTSWMNAARGGDGESGGFSSHQHIHNSPVDYKVHCSEFMQFPEVENLQDFYSSEDGFVHTQDRRGFYIMYDIALKDLEELKDELLLFGSYFVQRSRMKQTGKSEATEVDHVAVLLDLWTSEAEFLESKVQLLNCYFEAYQHATGTEERFALARVITDITYQRPQLDLNQDYFVRAYKAEISCLQSHQQLIQNILNHQITIQRQYLERIWRGKREGSLHDFGLPPNYVSKHLVSLGGNSPALVNTFLLEVHPSLCLASAVYQGLVQAHAELCQLHRATSVTDKIALQQKLLKQALQSWNNRASPGASYSSEIQKDLFSGVVFDDPLLVQSVGLTTMESAEKSEMKQGPEEQLHAVQTFSKLLELVTLRHRLLEAASETAHLALLYKNVALELGFDEFHLYLRPLQFECAEQEERVQQGPTFITTTQDNDSTVDRFTPPHLPLSIQELDENQIGRFSFSSEDSVIQLMNKWSLENLQVTLACQVVQKNALMSAVKLACICHWAGRCSSSAQVCESLDKDLSPPTRFSDETESLKAKLSASKSSRSSISSKKRLAEAFVSIQLEKVGLREEMLNSFLKKKKQAVEGFIKTPEEVAKIKRELILDFLRKCVHQNTENEFSTKTSLNCVRAQIVTYYYSLTSLLNDVPSIRRSHFTIGQERKPEETLVSGGDLSSDHGFVQHRPPQLSCADGKTLLNLWYIPHFTEVLHMFKTLDVSACVEALHHTLQIASALHDNIYYLLSFSKLGSGDNCRRRLGDAAGSHLAADWGGPEGIVTELQEIQQQVECLADPKSLQTVGRLLQLHRQVVLLQFDTAIRNLIREAFLSSGDVASYHSVSDNMVNALPLLSNSLRKDVFSFTLPVPQPLDTRGCEAQRMFAWRSFLACHGLLPLRVWDIPPIEYCMQLCLSGLNSRSRFQANAAILGASLLMEDVLNSGQEAQPLSLQGENDHDILIKGKLHEEAASPLDPIRVQSMLKGFFLLAKQLEVFKENWIQARLGVYTFRTAALYQQFVKLYRTEIFFPSMRALAHQMGKERDYEVLMSGRQSFLPPPGASEVDVKTWQLHLLMESAECDMIMAVQRRINTELTLAAAERTRQHACLPTEMWKKAPLKHSLAPERPQMVQTFIQQLMERAELAEGEVKVSQHHLQQCLNHLSSSVMERERQNFLFYSQFYEQILQQQTELLYHKEQDLKSLRDAQMSSSHKEAAGLCREMMLEISDLRTQVAHLKEEERTSQERLSLKYRERYDPVVRHLFSTCIQLQGRLDEYRRQMELDVSVMVNRARGEGVEKIIKLKNKYGCTRDNDGLFLMQIKKEEVHELKLEISQLSALLCKMKAVSRWRRAVDLQELHRKLLQSQQLEVSSRSEAVRVKMISEEKVFLLQEELDIVRQVLSQTRAECSSTKKLLSRKTSELQAARHQSAQEACSRQELDSYRVQSLEQMRGDMEDRDRQLRALSEQLDRDSRTSRLQRQRSAKQIRQVTGRLQLQSSLKQEAFQQVDKLQSQLNHMEALCGRSLTAGQSRAYYTLSLSRLSSRSPSAGPHRSAQQQLGSFTTYSTLQDFAAEPRRERAETSRGRLHTRDPSRLRVRTAEVLLPDL